MTPDERNLLGFERLLLPQDGVGDADLADVVQDACAADQLDPLLVHIERLRERDGLGGNGMGVEVRVAVAGVDCACQPFNGALQVELVALGRSALRGEVAVPSEA